jgi:hypothetical protein
MTSEISSRAACLAELTSNPKSFFNCPDLHGGSGLPEGSFRSGEMDPLSNLGKRNGVTLTQKLTTDRGQRDNGPRKRSILLNPGAKRVKTPLWPVLENRSALQS